MPNSDSEFRAVVNAETGDVFLQEVTSQFSADQHSDPGQRRRRSRSSQARPRSSQWPAGKEEFKISYYSSSNRRRHQCPVWLTSKQQSPSHREKDLFWRKWSCRVTLGLILVVSQIPTPNRESTALAGAPRGEKNHSTENDESDPRKVLSDLKGHVVLKNGVATFSRSFLRCSRSVGANARKLQFDQ